jgi:hypothetical protein
MEQINAGYTVSVNPFNANQRKRISLVPRSADMDPADGVDVLVFWTRNPRNILDNTDELTQRGFLFYVMVTVTGYPHELEPHMVGTSKVIATMKELSRKIGPDRVIWRYDPVILTSLTDEDFHRRNFGEIAKNLAGSVRRVIISLYNEYRSSGQRLDVLQKAGVLRMLKGGDGLAALLSDLAKCAEAAGMEIQSCALKEDYSPLGVKPGACIDPALIGRLWGLEFKGKDKNQRPSCLCCQSVDIGGYGTCEAGCVYCYAW